ncbi:Uncharacterised protein [Klebsiella aerogenes]|nr:Uncharacterised protein [Klebsiella aerogenes]
MILDPLGVNADIAFHEVETRALKETADGVGADIQAVNFIVVVLQQALGQMVTDKAIDAEDQHAGATLNRHHRFAADHRPGHQAQRLRQLSALHVHTAFGLAGDNFQRPVLARHDQRRNGDNGARFGCRQIVTDAGFPDDKLVRASVAERARPRIRDGTHQIVQGLRRLLPVEAAILRGTTPHVGRLAVILRALCGFSFKDRRQRLAQQLSGGGAQLTMQRQGRVIRANRHGLLGDDIAGIRAVHHAVQGDAGFAFAIDQHPVQRRTATIFRQQRTVQVKCPFRRQIEDLIAQQVAVVEGEQHVRLHLADTLNPQRMVHVFRRPHRNALLGGKARHGAKEMVFARVIRVGENSSDIIPGVQQGLDTGAAHIVISEDYGFHERSSSLDAVSGWRTTR